MPCRGARRHGARAGPGLLGRRAPPLLRRHHHPASATTGLPGTTIQPGARPTVTRLDVPSSVPCPDRTSTVVTATYATENADRVAFVLDGRQLPGEAGTSGRFELTIPCDGRTHVVLVTAVSPDNQTAVDSRAVTATD